MELRQPSPFPYSPLNCQCQWKKSSKKKKNIIGNYHERIKVLSNSLMNILARTLICSLWSWSETHLLQWQSCFVRIILHLLARLKWTVKMTIKSMNRIVNDIWIVWPAYKHCLNQKHPLCYMFVILYVTTNFEPTNEIVSNSKSLTATTCKWEKLFEVFGTVLENQN